MVWEKATGKCYLSQAPAVVHQGNVRVYRVWISLFRHEGAYTPLQANGSPCGIPPLAGDPLWGIPQGKDEVPIFGAGSAVASTHSRLPRSLPEKRYPYPTRTWKIKSLSFSMT